MTPRAGRLFAWAVLHGVVKMVGLSVALGVVLALAGCGGGDEPAGGPVEKSRSQAEADVTRYADQTAVLLRRDLMNPLVTTSPCAGGLYSVQGVYRVQLWITRQPKARADLRRVWLANKLPLTVDTTDDGWTGALGTVTPDGYTIDVVSLLKPPTTLSVQVRSPCFKDRS